MLSVIKESYSPPLPYMSTTINRIRPFYDKSDIELILKAPYWIPQCDLDNITIINQ